MTMICVWEIREQYRK